MDLRVISNVKGLISSTLDMHYSIDYKFPTQLQCCVQESEVAQWPRRPGFSIENKGCVSAVKLASFLKICYMESHSTESYRWGQNVTYEIEHRPPEQLLPLKLCSLFDMSNWIHAKKHNLSLVYQISKKTRIQDHLDVDSSCYLYYSKRIWCCLIEN